jgi:hypothetical protein
MKIEIITSFNKKYYDNIGKDCVDSWLKYWPEDLTLTCYVEEFTMPEHKRIKQIPFDNLCKEYFEFQSSNKNNKREKIFAKKAYCIIHALENSKADRIIWIDADTISTNNINEKILYSLCPIDTLITFMGVWHNMDKNNHNSESKFSVESGFFIVNKSHEQFSKFSLRYREYYDKKISQNLRRFYDGEVLGAVIKEFEETTKLNDLCCLLDKKYKSPLPYTPVGKYIKHYKSKTSKKEYLGK